MRHVLLAQWFIIAILAALIIAPLAIAQPSNGSWELVEDTDTRKVFEKSLPTATEEPTATSYIYGIDAQLKRNGTGDYQFSFTPDSAGTWCARIETTSPDMAYE